MSKFSLDVLERCVFSHINVNDPDVLLGTQFGEDFSLTRIKDGILVSHVDPIVGAVEGIGRLAVHVACNDIATSGTRPRWILPLVIVPSVKDEALLKEIMQDIGLASEEINVSVIGGHSGYSANLKRPLVAITALGTLAQEEPILTGGAQIGDHILVTKGVGLEGTAILANDFVDVAKKLGINEKELSEASSILENVSIIPEALILAKHGATAMHDVTRGGLMETLLEISSTSSVCSEVNFDDIPIPPIVSRFANAFQFDPLKMISSGTLASTVSPEKLEEAKAKLREANILFSDIGQIVKGEGVVIRKGDSSNKYTEIACEEDELARMWLIHKTNQ